MEKLPEEMDSQEQREAALSIAEHFDTLAEFAHETRTFGKLGGGQLVEIYREAHGLDPRNGDEPKPPIRTFDKTADIVCPECSQHFADPETFELHHSFDVPFGPGEGAMFRTQAEIASAFPERRRCGNANELLTRGLHRDGTSSRYRGAQPDTWYR